MDHCQHGQSGEEGGLLSIKHLGSPFPSEVVMGMPLK